MDAPSPQPGPSASATQDVIWRRRFWAAGTILFWIVLVAIAIYVVGLFITPLSYLIIGIILAYIFYPVVDKLARYIRAGWRSCWSFLRRLPSRSFFPSQCCVR